MFCRSFFFCCWNFKLYCNTITCEPQNWNCDILRMEPPFRKRKKVSEKSGGALVNIKKIIVHLNYIIEFLGTYFRVNNFNNTIFQKFVSFRKNKSEKFWKFSYFLTSAIIFVIALCNTNYSCNKFHSNIL